MKFSTRTSVIDGSGILDMRKLKKELVSTLGHKQAHVSARVYRSFL